MMKPATTIPSRLGGLTAAEVFISENNNCCKGQIDTGASNKGQYNN